MAEVTAAMVKELRETTGAGMMDCKKALVACDGGETICEEPIEVVDSSSSSTDVIQSSSSEETNSNSSSSQQALSSAPHNDRLSSSTPESSSTAEPKSSSSEAEHESSSSVTVAARLLRPPVRCSSHTATLYTSQIRHSAITSVSTWASVSCRLPLIEYASHSTGRTAGRRVIVTPFFSWSPTEAPDNLTWDRKRTEFPVGGVWLPVSAIRDEFSEVYLEKQRRSLEEVKQEGARAADFTLRQALITDEIVDKWINFSMIEEDTMTVTATAEVRRDIARYRQTEDGP